MGDPRTVQNKVFFEIMLYFCRRGRQNLRELKIKDFSSAKDDKGARYVTKSGDELTKNRREDDKGFEGGMMFEKPGPQCPVASLALYIKHLNPKNEFLFQRPKKGSKIGVDDVCFDNMVVGERTLGEKMKCISKEAELISIFANWYQAYSFVCMKRENNDWKGQLHAAFKARSMDPEFGSILASGRGGGRRQRIQFYIGIFGGLSFPFSGAPSEGLL